MGERLRAWAWRQVRHPLQEADRRFDAPWWLPKRWHARKDAS